MPLSDLAVRNAKNRTASYKLSDGHGLYLLVTPKGGRYWRFDYRHNGKRKTLALGVYPLVGLAEARDRHWDARKLVEDNKDPGAERKAEATAALIQSGSTFSVVAEEWLNVRVKKESAALRTYNKMAWLIGIANASIGDRPINEIPASEMLKILRALEAKGHLETAGRLRNVLTRIYRYAMVTDRADKNPAEALKEAITTPKVRHHAAILDPGKLGGLLRAIETYDGEESTRGALKLAPHVFVRPGELRAAEWSEVDLEGSVWRIPGPKMKKGLPHIVPLSRQARAIFEEMAVLTRNGRYVFPSLRSGDRSLSENTLNAALRRMGYTKHEMTCHGFRTIASTFLNESGYDTDWIERQLAHVEGNRVRAAYNAAEYLPYRTTMMQAWSNRLDSLKSRQAEIDDLIG